MPSWQDRVFPKVEDYDIKTFGSTVPAKVLNPDTNPIKAVEAGEVNGAVLPRFVWCKCSLWPLIVKDYIEL